MKKEDFILVIGSINIDMVLKIPRAPKKGESLEAIELKYFPGGKGANQAVAVARMGVPVYFVGKVGDDGFGRQLKAQLKRENINIKYLKTEKNFSTGTAIIILDKKGENMIVVYPGANMRNTCEEIDKIEALIKRAKILITQLEIPLEVIDYTLEKANNYGITTILDAGPAKKVPFSILKKVSILSPNETETEALTGITITDKTSLKKATEFLKKKGVKNIVFKLGSKGAFVVTEQKTEYIKPCKVKVVDVTAAGDTFTGVMAVELLKGKDIFEACKYANYAGALSVTKIGAQSSIPTKKELEEFIRRKSLTL